jgi:DNA repair protein RadA/Sms
MSFYMCLGEESAEQIKIRADRLNINKNNILFLGETDIDLIEAEIEKKKPKLVIIDSIQTIYSDKVDSLPRKYKSIKRNYVKSNENVQR